MALNFDKYEAVVKVAMLVLFISGMLGVYWKVPLEMIVFGVFTGFSCTYTALIFEQEITRIKDKMGRAE